MLSRNWRLLSRCITLPALERWFSENKTSKKYPIMLSVSAQEAFWAAHIIKRIRKANHPKMTDPCLKDKFLQMSKLQCRNFVLSDQVTNDFFKMFTEGVLINTKAFSQTRIKNAKPNEGQLQQENSYDEDFDNLSIKQNENEDKEVQEIQQNFISEEYQQAEVTQNKAQNEQDLPSEPFVFFPNVLVTRQMFKYLWPNRTNYLIYGGFGTSKTVSIMLFCYLTGKIHKFLYEASDKSPSVQQKQEAKHLNIKLKDYPRMWYWTINWQQATSRKFKLQNIILSQASQLPAQELKRLQKIQSLEDFFKELYNQFSSNLRHKIVIDQINTIASKIRKWNSFVDKYVAMVKKFQDQIKSIQKRLKVLQEVIQDHQKKKKQLSIEKFRQIDNEYKQFRKARKVSIRNKQILDIIYERASKLRREPIQNVMNMVQQLIKFGAPQTYILNSSMNIEDDIIGIDSSIDDDSQLNFELFASGGKLNLQLMGNHNELERVFLKFQQILHEDWARIDFYHFFWFEMEVNLRKNGLSDDLLKKIKEDYFQILKDAKPHNYSRFLWIKKYFQQNTDSILQKLRENIVKDTFRQNLKRIVVKDYNYFCKRECIQKVKKFMKKKGDNQENIYRKEVLLDLIFAFAIQFQINGNQKMEFKVQDLQLLLPQGKLFNLLLSRHHNNELLPLKYISAHREIIGFDWSVDEFIDIAKNVVNQRLLSTYESLQTQENKRLYLQNHNVLGVIAQLRLLDVLKEKVTVNFYDPYSRNWQNYQIKECLDFQTFNKNLNHSQIMSIQNNLKKVINAAKESKSNQGFLAIPTDNGKFVVNNRAIDFVIVKKQQQSQVIEINAFDVAVGDDVTNKQGKAKEFWRQMIIKLQKTHQAKFSINHTILCKKKFCKGGPYTEQRYVEQNTLVQLPIPFTLKRSSIEDLQLTNTANAKPQSVKFKICQQFIKKLGKKNN